MYYRNDPSEYSLNSVVVLVQLMYSKHESKLCGY